MPCKGIVGVVLEKQVHVTEIWKITKEIETENVNQRMQTEATVLQLKINNFVFQFSVVLFISSY